MVWLVKLIQAKLMEPNCSINFTLHSPAEITETKHDAITIRAIILFMTVALTRLRDYDMSQVNTNDQLD